MVLVLVRRRMVSLLESVVLWGARCNRIVHVAVCDVHVAYGPSL